MPNLPTVSAKITGDASGLISELKKAETQTSLSGAKMEADIGNALNRIERRFSLAHFGTDFLKGIGIGTGFQLIEKSAEMMAEYWKQAAESAKKVSDESEKQLAATLAGIGAAQTDKQKLITMQAQMASDQKKLDALNGPLTGIGVTGSKRMPGGDGYELTYGTVARDRTNAESEQAQSLATEMSLIGNKIAETQKKIDETAKKASESVKAATKDTRDYADIKEVSIADENIGLNTVRDMNAELDKEAEKYRNLGDPLKAYRDTLTEINMLEEKGALSGMDAARARAGNLDAHGLLTPNRAMMDAQSMDGFNAAYDKALLKTHELTDAQKQLADSLGRTFADAIMSGEKFGDVLKSLAADFLKMLLEKEATSAFGSIIGLLAGVGGGTGAAVHASGAGFADGGSPPVGQASMVGENGPELFIPNTAGTIVSNGALRSGSGGTYYIDARGADQTGLARLEAMIRSVQGSIKPTSLAAATDNRRRSAA